MLHRYWIELNQTFEEHAPGALLGIGVTAYTEQDALNLVQKYLFPGERIPSVKCIREDIRIPDLDQNHVIPNMGVVSRRGIWFPLGY